MLMMVVVVLLLMMSVSNLISWTEFQRVAASFP